MRSTVSRIVAHVRLLAGDASATPRLSDDQVATFLDKHRTFERYTPLVAVPVQTGLATVAYYELDAPRDWWESDAEVVDAAYQPVDTSAWTIDLDAGVWVSPTGLIPPFYATGSTFDVYAAAADCVDAIAASMAAWFDFSADQQEYKRSQARAGLAAHAKELRRQARPATIPVVAP